MAEKNFIERRSEGDRRKGERREAENQRKISILEGQNRRSGSRRNEDSDPRSGNRRKKQE